MNDERAEPRKQLKALMALLESNGIWTDMPALDAAVVAYEREPELKNHLQEAEQWQKVAERQLSGALNDWEEATAQIAQLRAALEKRDGGRHDPICEAPEEPCDCGHDEARRVLAETAPDNSAE